MNKDVISFINKEAGKKVWMPATIIGTNLQNARQAYVDVKGADKGESNYLTQKRPQKHGQFEVERGTFVANNHVVVEKLETSEIQQDARIIKLGAYRHLGQVGSDEDAQWARACFAAAKKISQLSNSTQAGDSQRTARVEGTTQQ